VDGRYSTLSVRRVGAYAAGPCRVRWRASGAVRALLTPGCRDLPWLTAYAGVRRVSCRAYAGAPGLAVTDRVRWAPWLTAYAAVPCRALPCLTLRQSSG